MKRETEKRYRIRLIEIMDFISAKSVRKRLHPQIEKLDEIFNLYRKYEGIIQRTNGKNTELLEDDNSDHLLIAAILCCLVIKVRPINQILDKSSIDLKPEEKYSNEFCAYLFGMQIIQDFWCSKASGNVSDEDKKIYSNPIMPPNPDDDKTTYPDWFIKLLNEEASKHFDCENQVLFDKNMISYISGIYFMIENYSYQFYKNLS